MFKKISIILMAIVMIISFNSAVFAGNNKSAAGSGINPAGKSNPGADNGNAWWKNNSCESDVTQFIIYTSALEKQVSSLNAENAALKAEIDRLKEGESRLMAGQEAPAEMDAIRFALQKSSEYHPNHPGVVGIYINMFSFDSFLTDQIMNASSGEYEVSVVIETPDGDVLNAHSIIQAEEAPKAGRDHWVGIVVK